MSSLIRFVRETRFKYESIPANLERKRILQINELNYVVTKKFWTTDNLSPLYVN